MEDKQPPQSALVHDPPPPPPPSIPSHHDHIDPVKEESPRKPVTGGGAGGDRLKRDEWSEGAVSTLLEAYEAKWVLRNRAKLKGHDWEDVARYVSSRANCTKSAKTQTQCKNKIESMKKRYRSESASGDASSSWPLYSRLDLLLRGTGPTASTTTMAVPLAAAAAAPSQVTHHGNNQGFVLLEPPLAVAQLPHQLQPPPVAVAAPPPIANAQNSHGSNGIDRLAKEDGLGTNKSSDQVSNKNMNATLDTDSSTPALYSHSKDHPTRSNNNNNKRKKKMDHRSNMKKMKRKSAEGKFNEMGIAESIRWLAEVVVRSEQARMEMMKEIEKMRVEAEAKRGEMDLKRTEIIANTQLEIARIFASVNNNKGVDSSLRIGRS
ncbi:trihelix transcription factor ASIL1 [Neltuma alba]|uniref:trihelix transcription factor ASIL1-like n=1 Tax=Neltuma alba TaxID=207710 RepID=UPI0010A4AA5E|nr:trihelix transcription factor ASIL1-like [Prosopis alba]XP_028796994.1 trihelix transcription factor ASIL1-like [Prosopis alba]